MAKYIHTYYFSTGSKCVHSDNPKPVNATIADIQKFGRLVSIHTKENKQPNPDKNPKGKTGKK